MTKKEAAAVEKRIARLVRQHRAELNDARQRAYTLGRTEGANDIVRGVIDALGLDDRYVRRDH